MSDFRISLSRAFSLYNYINNFILDFSSSNIFTLADKEIQYLNKRIDLVDLKLEDSKNKNITITGTNGKSTTAKILFDVLKNQKSLIVDRPSSMGWSKGATRTAYVGSDNEV